MASSDQQHAGEVVDVKKLASELFEQAFHAPPTTTTTTTPTTTTTTTPTTPTTTTPTTPTTPTPTTPTTTTPTTPTTTPPPPITTTTTTPTTPTTTPPPPTTTTTTPTRELLKQLCTEVSTLFEQRAHAYKVIYHDELIEPFETVEDVAYIVEQQDDSKKLVCFTKKQPLILQASQSHKKCVLIRLQAPNHELAKLAVEFDGSENATQNEEQVFVQLLRCATQKKWPKGCVPDQVDQTYMWHPPIHSSCLVNQMVFYTFGEPTHIWRNNQWDSRHDTATHDDFDLYTGIYIKDIKFLIAKLGLHGVKWPYARIANQVGMAHALTQWYVATTNMEVDLFVNFTTWKQQHQESLDEETKRLVMTCTKKSLTQNLPELVAHLSRYDQSVMHEFCESMNQTTTLQKDKDEKLKGGGKQWMLLGLFYKSFGSLGMFSSASAVEVLDQLSNQSATIAIQDTEQATLEGVTTNVTNVAPSDASLEHQDKQSSSLVSVLASVAGSMSTMSTKTAQAEPLQVAREPLFTRKLIDTQRFWDPDEQTIMYLQDKIRQVRSVLENQVIIPKNQDSLIEFLGMLQALHPLSHADLDFDVTVLPSNLSKEALLGSENMPTESTKRLVAMLSHWFVRSDDDNTKSKIIEGLARCYEEGNIFYTLSTRWLKPYVNSNPYYNLYVWQMSEHEKSDYFFGDNLIKLKEKFPYDQTLRYIDLIARSDQILLHEFSNKNESVCPMYVNQISMFLEASKQLINKKEIDLFELTDMYKVVFKFPNIRSMFDNMDRRIGGIFLDEFKLYPLRSQGAFAEALYNAWLPSCSTCSSSVIGNVVDKIFQLIPQEFKFSVPDLPLSDSADNYKETIKWVRDLEYLNQQQTLQGDAKTNVTALVAQLSTHTLADVMTSRLGKKLGKLLHYVQMIPLAGKYKPNKFRATDGGKLVMQAWNQMWSKPGAWSKFDVCAQTAGTDLEKAVCAWIQSLPTYDVEGKQFGGLVGLFVFTAPAVLKGWESFDADLDKLKKLVQTSLHNNPNVDVEQIEAELFKQVPVIYNMIKFMMTQTSDVPDWVSNWLHDSNYKKVLHKLHTRQVRQGLGTNQEEAQGQESLKQANKTQTQREPKQLQEKASNEQTSTIWQDVNFQVVSTHDTYSAIINNYYQGSTTAQCFENAGTLTAQQVAELQACSQGLQTKEQQARYAPMLAIFVFDACASGWDTPLITSPQMEDSSQVVVTCGQADLMRFTNESDLDTALRVMPPRLADKANIPSLAKELARPDVFPLVLAYVQNGGVLAVSGNFQTQVNTFQAQIGEASFDSLLALTNELEVTDFTATSNDYNVTFFFTTCDSDSMCTYPVWDETLHELGLGNMTTALFASDTIMPFFGDSTDAQPTRTNVLSSFLESMDPLVVVRAAIMNPDLVNARTLDSTPEDLARIATQTKELRTLNDDIVVEDGDDNGDDNNDNDGGDYYDDGHDDKSNDQVAPKPATPPPKPTTTLSTTTTTPSSTTTTTTSSTTSTTTSSTTTTTPTTTSSTTTTTSEEIKVLEKSLLDKNDLKNDSNAYADNQGGFNMIKYFCLSAGALNMSIATNLVSMIYLYIRTKQTISFGFAFWALIFILVSVYCLDLEQLVLGLGLNAILSFSTHYLNNGGKRDWLFFGTMLAVLSSQLVYASISVATTYYFQLKCGQGTTMQETTLDVAGKLDGLRGAVGVARDLVDRRPDFEAYKYYMIPTKDLTQTNVSNTYGLTKFYDNKTVPLESIKHNNQTFYLQKVGLTKRHYVCVYAQQSELSLMTLEETVQCIVVVCPPNDGTQASAWTQPVPTNFLSTNLGKAFATQLSLE